MKKDLESNKCLETSGGYNIESTGVTGERLMVLILLITLAYSSAIIMGEKINSSGVACYVGRVKEAKRKTTQHILYRFQRQ